MLLENMPIRIVWSFELGEYFKDGQILYISSVDISVGNGPGVNEREFILAAYLAMGKRVHFLVPKPVNGDIDIPMDACTFTYPHLKHHLLHFPLHVISQIVLAHKLLSQEQFDLIVFRLDLLPFAPMIITRIHRVPYALKTLGQGFVNTFKERWGVMGKLLYKINLFMAQRLVKGAILADSVSQTQVTFLKNLFSSNANNIVWIDNAVNTKRFFPSSSSVSRKELNLSRFDPILGYVGTRPWERGGMQLVEIAPLLIENYPDLGIVVLGDGDKLDEMKRKAKELGVEEHCVFPGYVPFVKVPAYVNSLDIGVSINLIATRYASAELKVRQYLACGKPVIISPGSNDFVIDNGFGSVVKPDDLNEITEAVEKWLSLSENERKAFSTRTAEYMRNHMSIEAAVSQRIRLWSEQLQVH